MKHEVFTPGQEAFIKSMYGVGSRDKDAMEALSSYWLLVDDLSEKLSAERARRIKAEEALQEHKRIMRTHMTNCPNFRYDEVRKTIGQKQLEEDADRAQYPRVEKESE